MAKVEFSLRISAVLFCLVLHVAYAAGAVNGGHDVQAFLAFAHNTTDGVEIQILSSFSNHTCDHHPSATPNGTSILVSGHYLPDECIPDLKHCNTKVIPWKEQVFILVPIRNGVAIIEFQHNQSHCHLQYYVNHTTSEVTQDCNPVHIFGNGNLLFIACLNVSDSNNYLQFLRLYADFDRLSGNNATFTASPISPRKQAFTLSEFLYVHEELSCCPDSVYFINNSYIVQFAVTRQVFYYLSAFPGDCAEFQKVEYHGNNSLLFHCSNETVLILVEPCRNMFIPATLLSRAGQTHSLSVSTLSGVIVTLVAVATVAVVATIAVTILYICRKSRGYYKPHISTPNHSAHGCGDLGDRCPSLSQRSLLNELGNISPSGMICSSQQQQSPLHANAFYCTFSSPPSSCTSTPTYCASLYHDHMNPSGSKSDTGYSSNSTSVRASFISNNYIDHDNCEASEHESPEFLYYGHELHTRSPERAWSHLPAQTESCSGLLVPVSTHRVAADTPSCTVPGQNSSLYSEHQKLHESAHLDSSFSSERQHLGDQIPVISTSAEDTDLPVLFPVDSTLQSAATTDSSVPFMDPLDIIHCTSNGGVYYNPVHDFTVRIPEGAISKGASVTIEIGVALYGPFQFPDGTQPVSPIVWLCVQQEGHYQFLKPVEVVLPHYLHVTTADDSTLLHFLKAGHHMNENEQYQFQFTSGKVCFPIHETYGTLSTNHFCFLCIASRTVSQERTAKAKFCLISVIPDPISEPSWTIYFCVCYFLQTCMEAVLRQFPGGFRISKKTFRFSAPLQAAKIEIDFERKLKGGWILTCQHGTKISASEVDFWSADPEELQLLHDEKLYPPRFVVRVGGDVATEDTFAQICFRGVVEDLDTELELRVYRQSLQLMSSDSGLQPVRAASMPALGYPRTATSQFPTCRMLVDNTHGDWPMMPLEYPTDQELEGVTNDVLGKLGHDWTKLQHFLQVPDHVMVEIDSEPTVHRRMVRMLKEWRNHSGDESKAVLAKCLKASDKRLETTSKSLLSDEYRMLTPPSSRSGSVSSSSTPNSSLGRRMRSIDDTSTPLSRKNARREYGCGSISETSESATM